MMGNTKKDYIFTGYNPDMKDRIRELRKHMIKQEKRLWYEFLRDYPVKFYRQRSIDHYIADFYCSEANLVVELDSSQHYLDKGIHHDQVRTEVLRRYGLDVIRFSNKDVQESFYGVCTRIDQKVKENLGKVEDG